MKSKCLLLIQILLCVQLSAQNLIPNGDFEQYNACPTNYSQLDSALYWINPATPLSGGGTSDYFHQCSSSLEVSVPFNLLAAGGSFQLAHSGLAYGGLLTFIYTVAEYREYMEIELTSTLISGETYKFEMYISLANVCEYTSNSMQIYFSNTLISGVSNFNPLPFIPQISNLTTSYPDSLNWLLLTGNYTAQGGEQFIIIGNFNNDANTTLMYLGSNGSNFVYFYVDDVSLTNATSLIDFSQPFKSNVFPNPFENEISIDVDHFEKTEFHLYDNLMREVNSVEFISNTKIQTENLSDGIYFYVLKCEQGNKSGKLIKTSSL